MYLTLTIRIFKTLQLVMVVDARNPLFYRCPDLEVLYIFSSFSFACRLASTDVKNLPCLFT